MADSLYIVKEKDLDKEGYIIAHYKLKTKLSSKKIAMHVAAEQSTGTWLHVERETPQIIKRYGAKAFNIRKSSFKLAFPIENFEGTNIPMLLSTVAGNLFGMKGFDIRLEDVEFPKRYLNRFSGPKFGILGVRNYLRKDKGPLLGTIIKPDIGLSPEDFADVCREAAYGVDFIKDDELLSNQDFCWREERIPLVMEALDKVKEETNREYLYAVNITDNTSKILENADRAVSAGAKCIMINFLTVGISSINALAEDPSINVPIHCHRDFHAAFTKNKEHGVAFPVIAKIVRLCGGDLLHIGTSGIGKMADKESLKSRDYLTEGMHISKTFPVCSGGVKKESIKPLVRAMGPDIVIMSGGGIHGHKNGTKAGALELRKELKGVKIGRRKTR